MGRPTWVEVDLSAVRANVAALAACVRTARICAVVKADGYGHGAEAVSAAALAGGAEWLAVALVEEGLQLRAAGIDAPILLLSEPPLAMVDLVAEHSLRATVYSEASITALGRAGAAAGCDIGVHLKVDTGMHRVGAQPDEIVALAQLVAATPGVRLEGTCTHLAVADDVDNPATDAQLRQFEKILGELRAQRIDPGMTHAANSAGAMGHPHARFDLVRCGIATYGLRPDDSFAPERYGVTLRPAMTVRSRVTHVKRLPAGARVSYGHLHELHRESTVATVPIGYADGVPRRLSAVGGEVLIGGRRRPMIGRVTMDQILVDCGEDTTVSRDDDVVLIGRQGHEEISAWEWATALDTIAYEITCAISARVPRHYTGALGREFAREA